MTTKHVSFDGAPAHLIGEAKHAAAKAYQAQRGIHRAHGRRRAYWARVHEAWQTKFGSAMTALQPWAKWWVEPSPGDWWPDGHNDCEIAVDAQVPLE